MGPWLNSCGSCNTLVVLEWGKVGRWDDGGCVAGEPLFFEADDLRSACTCDYFLWWCDG